MNMSLCEVVEKRFSNGRACGARKKERFRNNTNAI